MVRARSASAKGGISPGSTLFAAATVMSNGKKTPGAMIRHGFPDAKWIEGRRLHKAVATVDQTWVKVTASTRADALGRALALGDEKRQRDRTLVFVNSTRACEEVTAELIGGRGSPPPPSTPRWALASARARLASLANGNVTVLVCTDSAARGVDAPEVVHVVQARFAANAVDYLHRIGRTARCGASGRVTNLRPTRTRTSWTRCVPRRRRARRGGGVQSQEELS